MSIALVHSRIATAMVLFTIVAAIYGLVEYLRHKPVSPNYWGVIVVGNLLALGQAGLGIWLALDGARPDRGWIHIIYGTVAVLWVPLITLASRGRTGRSETLLCTLVSLFEFGISLRALTTG